MKPAPPHLRIPRCRGVRFAAAALALAGAGPGGAQEYQPYASPRVTPEQFASYLATVRASHEASAEIYEDRNLVVFSDPDTRTFYIFTTRNHPAHPAWITRQLVEDGGQVRVRQIGYFAGAQEPFDLLFREHLQLNEELKKSVEHRNR